MSTATVYLDATPGETFFTEYLQQTLSLTLGKKNIKTGKLIIFKRAHYLLQLTFQNSRNNLENIEIPFPFNTEYYPNEKIMYFDYRIKTLANNNVELEHYLKNFKIKNTLPSQYYDKILEINVLK
jgi:hypothetical protein